MPLLLSFLSGPLLNTTFPFFFFTAKYDKNVSTNHALFNGVVESTLPYDGSLHEMQVDLKPNVKNDYQIFIYVTVNTGIQEITFVYRSQTNSTHQRVTSTSFPALQKYAKIKVGIWNKAGFISPSNKNKPITSDFANICLKFTPR